jgi:2-oxoglutarate dehydrogenase E2 component (dihydrolipoamide succinyltransferase)
MIDVVMPQMGESIVEGTLTKWLKKPGERVERDEALFEISTDKVDTEIPAPVAGTLAEVLVEEGVTVAINTVVARLDETGGAVVVAAAPVLAVAAPEPAPVQAPPAAPAEAAPAPSAAEEPAGRLSPLVRRMAREHNIDLKLVKGTGEGGRITKQDVEAYLAQRALVTAPLPAAAAAPPAPGPAVGRARIEPMSVMRQKIAEHMVMSKRVSPHVTTVHKVDMTKVARLRERHKDEVKQRYGLSLTYLPFIARAAAAALRAFPIVNASIDGTNIVYHEDVNIGIAVALEGGLIVPVVRQADEKTVIGLQRAIADLASRARSKQLKPDEVQGGTFSITNFGSYGSLFGTPVINQPQVAILGVGTVEKTPVVVEDDAIAIRSICLLGLTFDHRLLDGALADQFMGKLRSVLEGWCEEVL